MNREEENKIIRNIGWTAKSFADLFRSVGQLVEDIGELKKSIDEAIPEEPTIIEVEYKER